MESTFLQDNMFFIIAAIVSGGMLLFPMISRSAAKEINVQQAIKLINYENALVLDVRDDGEFAEGHLPNSKHIPVERINDRLQEIEKYKDNPIVIIFSSGLRAVHAAALDEREGDVLPDLERVKEGSALEEHAELAVHGFAGGAAHARCFLAVDLDGALVWLDQAEDAFQHDGLAGA